MEVHPYSADQLSAGWQQTPQTTQTPHSVADGDESTTERSDLAGFAGFAGSVSADRQDGPVLRWWIDLLDATGSRPIGATTKQCPAHLDGSPSLSLGEGDDGRALLYCFAGCTWNQILRALQLPRRYLTAPPPVPAAEYARAFCPAIGYPPLTIRPGRSPRERGYQLAAIHDYGADHRVLRYRKDTSKELIWETRREECWIPGLFGTPTSALPLYRESDIHKAIALDEPVLLVESESSVDTLTGWYSTTWAGGAGSVQIDRLTEVLGGYGRTVVIPDNDSAGLACLARIRASGLAPHVVMPAAGEDARDLYQRVGADVFTALIRNELATERATR